MTDRYQNYVLRVVKFFELVVTVLVFVGIGVFFVNNFAVIPAMDWRQIDTFYEFINRILLLVIGLELIRMLVMHDLMAALELLAFVIARKMLKPEVNAIDLLMSVVAFTLLLLSRRFLLTTAKGDKQGDGQPSV